MCAAENRHIKTSKSSVARSVDKFVEAMLKRKDDFIYFPNTEDAIDQYKQDFFTYTGIPNTIGAIDGTHVPIVCPRSRDAIQFYNRKGFPSINVAVSIFLCNIDPFYIRMVHCYRLELRKG